MKMIFNEKRYVENLLENKNKVESIDLYVLKMIAKYFDSIKDDKKLAIMLREYVASKVYIYDEGKYEQYIDKCVKYCKKNGLMKECPLPITDNEKNRIFEIEDCDIRRLCFFILMYSKNYWINVKYSPLPSDKLLYSFSLRELFRYAGVPYKSFEENISIIKKTEELGLLDWKYGNYCEILFYENDDKSLKNYIKTDDIREFSYVFDKKYRVFECKECGKMSKVGVKDNKSILCKECKKRNNNLKNKERVKKYRDGLTSE